MSKGALQPCPPDGAPRVGAIGGMAFTGNLNGVVTTNPGIGTLAPVGLGSPAHPLWVLDPSLLFDIVLSPGGSPNETQFQRLRYIGQRKLCAAITVALSVQEPAVGAVGYTGAVDVNGFIVGNSPMDAQTGGLITSADSLSAMAGAVLETNDRIGAFVSNDTNLANLIVSAGHIQVVGFFVE